jgi:hypothetical protein
MGANLARRRRRGAEAPWVESEARRLRAIAVDILERVGRLHRDVGRQLARELLLARRSPFTREAWAGGGAGLMQVDEIEKVMGAAAVESARCDMCATDGSDLQRPTLVLEDDAP